LVDNRSVTQRKFPSPGHQKAGPIRGSTGRLFHSDFYTPGHQSKVYATGVRERSPVGPIEYGIRRDTAEDGRPQIIGYVRWRNSGWLDVEVVEKAAYMFGEAVDRGADAGARWRPRRVPRIPNLAGIDAWVERRDGRHRIEWRDEAGDIQWMPVEVAPIVASGDVLDNVLATALGYASIEPRMTIVQIARRMPELLPGFIDALDAQRRHNAD
jgi:hypothetical protein